MKKSGILLPQLRLDERTQATAYNYTLHMAQMIAPNVMGTQLLNYSTTQLVE